MGGESIRGDRAEGGDSIRSTHAEDGDKHPR
jgi:hypothetical protein